MVLDAEDPNGRFSLVVSLLHVVVDRHTYHNIYKMLNKTAPAMYLSPERRPCIATEDVHAQMGSVMESWLARRFLRTC